MEFPPACPEVPVAKLGLALAYYRDCLGFAIDWSADELGLAGVSRGNCRLFIGDTRFRADLGTGGAMVLWLNLGNRAEVDALHREWADAGAEIIAAPAAQPHRLYEFRARDPDGNTLRVFYDFSWEK